MKKFIILGICLFLLFPACAKKRRYVRPVSFPPKRLIVLPEKSKDSSFRPYVVNGERYYPLPDSDGFVQTGNASWYGKKFHGRPTASGERFNMYKESAAHKTLPLGTFVRVVNFSNKKQIIVKINDRGPFVKGRIIDLSYAAAKKIDLIGPGVARVRVVTLGRQVGQLKSPQGIKPVVEIRDLNLGDFTVQVGAFQNKDNALKLADRLKVIFDYVDISVHDARVGEGTLYKVRVSKSKTLNKAGEIEKKLEAMGFDKAFIVSL